MSKILFLISDDWTRVYLDGKIICDDHSARVDSIVNALIGKTLTEQKKVYFHEWEKINDYECTDNHFDEFAEEEKEKYFKNIS